MSHCCLWLIVQIFWLIHLFTFSLFSFLCTLFTHSCSFIHTLFSSLFIFPFSSKLFHYTVWKSPFSLLRLSLIYVSLSVFLPLHVAFFLNFLLLFLLYVLLNFFFFSFLCLFFPSTPFVSVAKYLIMNTLKWHHCSLLELGLFRSQSRGWWREHAAFSNIYFSLFCVT